MQCYLIYGTAWKEERTAELALKAWRAGFRAFDTACQPKHYNEGGLGEAIEQLLQGEVKRSELYLQSKFTPVNGQDPLRIPYDPQAPLSEQVTQSFNRSLANLKVDYLDALILHSPLSTMEDTFKVWQSLERIQQAGGTRQLGISNCYDLDLLKQLHRQALIKPTIVQNRFHGKSGYDIALRRWCLENHITYQSFWTLTANRTLLDHPVIQSISETLNKTPAQILFRYLHQQGVMPLTGTTSEQHMHEDLAIAEFAIEKAETDRIDTLLVGRPVR